MTQGENGNEGAAGVPEGIDIVEGFEAEEQARRAATAAREADEAAERAEAPEGRDRGMYVDTSLNFEKAARRFEQIERGAELAAERRRNDILKRVGANGSVRAIFEPAVIDDAAWLLRKEAMQFVVLVDDLAKWAKEHGEKFPRTLWVESIKRREREQRDEEKEAKRRAVEVANDDGDESLPVVMLGFDHERTGDECIELLGRRSEVFQRHSALVRTIRAPGVPPIDDDATPAARAAHQRALRRSPDEGALVIEDLPAPTATEMLSSLAEFRRRTEQGDRRVAVPDALASRIVARRRYDARHVRPLVAVVTAPCLLPGGDFLTTPGYHRASGYYLDGPEVEVPERPTRGDAEAAAERIVGDLFADFAFRGGEDEQRMSRAVVLASILAPLARPSIDGPTPATMFAADDRGAGKTLIAETCGAVVLGRVPAARPWTDDEDEMRKTLTSIAIAAPPCALFDNVRSHIAGGALESVLTSTTFAPRQLHTMTSPELPWRTVLFLTANEATFSPDAARRFRFALLRGAPDVSGGSARRAFKHPRLVTHALNNRNAILSDALTILRAHQLAGRPQGATLATFEAWAEIVSSAVAWAYGADPALARPPEGADRDRATSQAVLAAWCRALYNEPLTLSQVRGKILPPPGVTVSPALCSLRDALADFYGVPDLSRVVSNSLAMRLARFCDRPMEAPWGGTMRLDVRKNRGLGVLEYVATSTIAPPRRREAARDEAHNPADDRDGGDL